MAYKAEKFIEEAILGGLNQTYDNMEIIISDDASPDKTFEIAKHIVSNYKGDKQIRLLQNEKNLGLAAHINKLWFEEAKGEWIVVSAGDDVSLPERVATLAPYMVNSTGAIHHDVIAIDENSSVIDVPNGFTNRKHHFDLKNYETLIYKNQWLRGATMSLNTSMLKSFGPFNLSVVNEDNILAYRSEFYGGITYVEKKLLKYRIHSESLTEKVNTKNAVNLHQILIDKTNRRISQLTQIISDNNRVIKNTKLNKWLIKQCTIQYIKLSMLNGISVISLVGKVIPHTFEILKLRVKKFFL